MGIFISVCLREVTFVRGARKLLIVGLLLGALGTPWEHGTRQVRPLGNGEPALYAKEGNQARRPPNGALGPPWREI